MSVLLALLGCADPVPAGPAVVLVTVETLRADRLGFAGHAGARTPVLDRLAARGRVFEQATTPLPRTTPSLSTLQTGLWPKHHGSREVGDPMTATRTLASTLSGEGWATVAVSAMKVAGPEQRLDVGYDRFEVRHDAPAAEITEAALAAVRSVDRSDPLLLWVHYADPHFPYLPESPEGGDCRALGQLAAKGKLQRQELFANRDGRAAAILADCQGLYDGEIASVDAAVGALLDGLGAVGRVDPVVVFTADHGENHGEDGLWFEHGPSLDDAAMRIPLVVAGPGVAPGRDAGVARTEDVTPTLLDWLELPVEGFDGTSLAPRLRGGEGGPELALAESGSALQAGLHGFLVSGRARRWCVNGPRYAWCEGPRGSGLYDHLADPDLKHDLQAEQPEVAARLREAAARWAPETGRELAARTPAFKLVARPALEGGYTWTLYDLAGGGVADAPEVEARMRAALEAWAERPLPRSERTASELEALRALGYVE